jgi:hypothetical protein
MIQLFDEWFHPMAFDISNLMITFWRNAVNPQNGRCFPLPHTTTVTVGGSTLPEMGRNIHKSGEGLASVHLYDIIGHSTWFQSVVTVLVLSSPVPGIVRIFVVHFFEQLLVQFWQMKTESFINRTDRWVYISTCAVISEERYQCRVPSWVSLFFITSRYDDATAMSVRIFK